MSAGFVAAAFRLAGMAGRFLLLLMIGRLLSPEDLGTYGLFAVTCVLLVQVVGLELHQPAVRQILHLGIQRGEGVVRAQMRVYSCMYLLLAPAALVVHSLGMLSLAHAALLVVAIIGSHLAMETHRLLIAASRPQQAFLVLSLSQGLWVFPLALAMTFLPSTRSLTLIFAAWACASILAATYGYAGLRAARLVASGLDRRPDLAFLKDAWPSAAIFAASSTAFILCESVDRYFLEHYRGHADVGVYTLYASIARALREIAYAAILTGALPGLLTSVHHGDLAAARDRQRRIHERLSRYLLAGTPCLAVGLALILPFLNDAIYAEHLPAYFVLLTSAVVGTCALAPHYLLYAAGRERSILAAHLAGLVTMSAASWALVPEFGIEGAAAASLLAALVLFAVKHWAAHGILRVN